MEKIVKNTSIILHIDISIHISSDLSHHAWSWLLLWQLNIVLHHFVYLHAHLLVYFLLYQSCVCKQSHQKCNCHEYQDQQHCFPDTFALIISECSFSIIFQESITLFWWSFQGFTNHFKDIRGFEESVEVPFVDCGFWVKENVMVIGLINKLLQNSFVLISIG